MYAYGVALDKMLKAGQIAQYRNATAFMRYFPQSFIGMSGNVTINEKGTRNPTLFLLALDENNNNTRMATIYVENMSAVRYIDQSGLSKYIVYISDFQRSLFR